MLYRDICRIVGLYLLLLAAFVLIPLGLSLYYQFFSNPVEHPQPYTTLDFLYTILATLGLSALFLFFGRDAAGSVYRKEGLAAVVLIWMLTPALSSLPFLTSGTLKNFWQAYFEMASGYTTTGSTVLMAKKFDPTTGQEIPYSKTFKGSERVHYQFYGTVEPVRNPHTGDIIKEGIEAVEKTLLFWRSLTQWIGGGGIVILFVAVLPLLGVGGKLLFQAEVTGPSKAANTPRVKETAMRLWKIYLYLSLLQVAALLLFNRKLPLFDAVTLTFATISTGGFSIKNESIAAYHSPPTEWVIILFMIAGSVNFSLYYQAGKGKFYRLYETEFLLYLALLVLLCAATAYTILGAPQIDLTGLKQGIFTASEALRHGVFEMVSAMSSTGFATTNYDHWPYAAQALLWIAMFFGGMSGSTAGGIKTIRLFILFRLAQYKVESLFHPESLRIFRIEKWEVDPSTALTVLVFFLIVASISALGSLLYIFDGIDLETALGLVACMVNNTGFSFRMAGPEYSCAFLSNSSLIISSLLMIMGRLEFYALLALLVPAFWKKN